MRSDSQGELGPRPDLLQAHTAPHPSPPRLQPRNLFSSPLARVSTSPMLCPLGEETAPLAASPAGRSSLDVPPGTAAPYRTTFVQAGTSPTKSPARWSSTSTAAHAGGSEGGLGPDGTTPEPRAFAGLTEVCRICERPYYADCLEAHTELCAGLQKLAAGHSMDAQLTVIAANISEDMEGYVGRWAAAGATGHLPAWRRLQTCDALFGRYCCIIMHILCRISLSCAVSAHFVTSALADINNTQCTRLGSPEKCRFRCSTHVLPS